MSALTSVERDNKRTLTASGREISDVKNSSVGTKTASSTTRPGSKATGSGKTAAKSNKSDKSNS